MTETPYIRDMRSQAAALKAGLDGFDGAPCRSLRQDIKANRFDRIILSGMGSSTYGTYPAWLEMVAHGLPVFSVESGELLHYANSLITPRTLLWLTSQSGRTAEVVSLLEHSRTVNRPAFILGMTNEPGSDLGRGADAALFLQAGEESTVSTKTYLNTLAIAHLTALCLCGESLEGPREDLARTQAGIRDYLDNFDTNLAEITRQAGKIERLFLLGRGPSVASVDTCGLTLKESTKFPVVGLNAGQFRHGPLELADEHLTAVIFEGQPATADLNRRLGEELAGYGTRVLWVGAQPAQGALPLPMPTWSGIGLPLAETLPMQLLSLALAQQTGFAPGVFRRIGKVTLSE
jgi:glutamine---fructose-6-phosphate transaminase (isomerizing)